MIKKTLTLTLVAGLSLTLCLAQKQSAKTMTIPFVIEPSKTPPESPVTYRAEIITPINPFAKTENANANESARRNKLYQTAEAALKLSGSSFIREDNPGADWIVSLVTTDVKVTGVNDKPLYELALEDEVFRYSYGSQVMIKDKSGNVLWEEALSKPEEEKSMTKAMLFFNPMYRAKVRLNKNDPEKLKALHDEMMADKNHLVLTQTVDDAGKALENAYATQVKNSDVSIFSVKGKDYGELSDLSEKVFDTYAKFRAFSKKNRIPKEDFDKVLREAIPVWEKYANENKELEEKAKKGLLLNCAVASSLVGDYAKADDYLNQVPEAAKGEDFEEDMEEESSPTSPGTTVFLSFDQSAQHARELNEMYKKYESRMKITQ